MDGHPAASAALQLAASVTPIVALYEAGIHFGAAQESDVLLVVREGLESESAHKSWVRWIGRASKACTASGGGATSHPRSTARAADRCWVQEAQAAATAL